ncbi:flagellar basal body-associated FliL family protein [Loktanella sp. S4079]|uniref:flagellar basal body-associated FliL family protein n=1 Tax=Loktanella sp. S4079 TaxID=579483 RepID=UPI0005FA1F65|nr:flagellar basal body-associated FliL family protein [Loktanella sp. S4079]KJZ21153.1 flagellar basal body-associated protein FliL [Loktanella sp. S4079]
MKNLLLPLLLLLVGTGSGVGAGLMLMPEEETLLTDGNPCGEITETTHAPVEEISLEREYAKLNNQFVIPVVEDGLVAALVVTSISLEVTTNNTSVVHTAEPKLRDAFLQVMFDHANIGGFSGNFTTGTNMRALRNELLQSAQQIAGEVVTDVLITDIVRQDS